MSPTKEELTSFLESFQQYELSRMGGVFIPFPPPSTGAAITSHTRRTAPLTHPMPLTHKPQPETVTPQD